MGELIYVHIKMPSLLALRHKSFRVDPPLYTFASFSIDIRDPALEQKQGKIHLSLTTVLNTPCVYTLTRARVRISGVK